MKKDSKLSGQNPEEPAIRDHVYDGIMEYDHRLPNWWLWTFYGAIIITVIYWLSWYQTSVAKTDSEKLQEQLAMVEDLRLTSMLDMLNDTNLWEMSQNGDYINQGRNVYMSKCVACHGPNLEGGVGLKLSDKEWIHGGNPTQIFKTVSDGVPAKGMQAWMNELGPKKIAQVVSFVLSHHQEDNPLIKTEPE